MFRLVGSEIIRCLIVTIFQLLTVHQLGHDDMGVKNLVVKKHNLLATKIVGNIIEQRQGKLN